MASQVQFRRGTTTQNNAFTGAIGEISVDTDLKTIRLHDGTTAGGGSTMLNTVSTQTALNKTFSTGSVWQGNAVGLAYGGTGSSLTANAGAVPYSTSNGLALSASGTSGQILTSGGLGAPTWVNPSTITVGISTTATTATNIAGGSAGQLIIQADTGLSTFITAGAAGTFLKSAGAGYAPTWAAGQVTIGSTSVALGNTITSIDGLDILTATGTSHWKIPVGTTAQRPATPATGAIRYNSEQVTFEGYSSGAWSSLGGVTAVNKYTFIRAETSAGAANGDLDFFAQNAGATAATQVGQWNRTNLKDYTGTLVGTQTTQNVFNTTATTLNIGGAATTLALGASTGTATIANPTVTLTNATALNLNGASPVIATTSTTASLFNSNVTTLNIGGAATTLVIGASTGTTTVNNNLVVTGNLTINGTTTTVNATTLDVADLNITVAKNASTAAAANGAGLTVAGPATPATLLYGSASDNWTFNKPLVVTGTLSVSSNATVGGTLGVTGATTLAGLSATTGSFSSTLSVTGASTLTGGWSSGGASVNGTDAWLRTTGATGWYNGTYSVGMYATQTGWIQTYGSAGVLANAFQIVSDERLKENIKDSDYGLSTVLQLRSVQYDKKADGKHDIGLIAQDVEKIIPEFIHEDADGMKSVNYPQMVSVLIKAVQELSAEVNALKAQLGK